MKKYNSLEVQTELIQGELKNIKWAVNKYKRLFFELDRAEIESACYFALFKASRRFDESQGYKFRTYADRCIKYEIFAMAKKNGLETVSYETPIELDDKKIIDTLEIEDFSQQVLLSLTIEEALAVLSDKEKQLFHEYYVEGYDQGELAEKYCYHTNSMNRLFRKAKEKIRDNYVI